MTSRLDEMLTRAVARVCVELQSPLHIGSGSEDALLDGVVVKDANGLPCIPGTSLTGVIRSHYRQCFGIPKTNELFGYSKQDLAANESANITIRDTAESRIEVSFAHLHDSKNQPVPQRASAERLSDELLCLAMNTSIRDHVKINHRGASSAEERALFNEEVVATGHRFTFEVAICGQTAAEDILEVLGIVSIPSFQIGGRTGRGLGSWRLLSYRIGEFNLQDQNDFKSYSMLPADICQNLPEGILNAPSASQKNKVSSVLQTLARHVVSVSFTATPIDFWLVGGGDADAFDTPAHIVPYTEPRVEWQKDCADIRAFTEPDKNGVVIPGASIRGALRHRTIFHYNALNGYSVNTHSNLDQVESLSEPEPVTWLFGIKAGEADKSTTNADGKISRRHASRVTIHDVTLKDTPPGKLIYHNTIDRFTQGTIDGALFQEWAFFQGEPWVIQIDFCDITEADERSPEIAAVLLAFRLAIDDLRSGALMIGSGAGRGHGYLSGSQPDNWPSCLNADLLTGVIKQPSESPDESMG